MKYDKLYSNGLFEGTAHVHEVMLPSQENCIGNSSDKARIILMNKESNIIPLRGEALLITSEESEASQMYNLKITEASQIK